MTIAKRDIAEFNAPLTAYYDSADGAALKRFLYENAIDGIVTEERGWQLGTASKD